MTKDELLQELSVKISTGEISKTEVSNRLGLASGSVNDSIAKIKKVSYFSITKLFYTLGAIIAVFGLVLFASQIWNDIGSAGRIFITLGLGLIITGIGSFLSKNKPEHTVGAVFHFIGGMLIPGGAMVALYEVTGEAFSSLPTAFIFSIIFAFYLLLTYIHRNAMLTFFAILNGTAFIYFTFYTITDGMFTNYTNLYAYLTIVIGACYVLLAYSFRDGWNSKLSKSLYFLGFGGIELAAFVQYNSFSSYNNDSLWPITFSLMLVFLFCLFFNFVTKKTLLTLLTIINGTAFIYVFVETLIGGSFYQNGEIYSYLTMVIGVVYLLLSHEFRDGWNNKLVLLLDFFGIMGLLGAGFSRIYGSPAWQLFYLVLIAGGFMYSIYSRSRSVLIVSTLFLLGYISYITSEYFADSIGWPMALVILGFLFIGLGYISININKKYIANN
jgi:hypothetical protein